MKMESKYKLKEIDIKSYTRHHFDDLIRCWERDVEFSNILLDEKSYETFKNI